MTALDRAAGPGESVESLKRREAEATWMVWLPLAVVRIVQALEGAWGGKPRRASEILRGIALPEMAEAIAKDERRADEEDMLEGFKALQKRFGKDGGK